MNDALLTIATNLDMDLGIVILIGTMVGTLLFYAADVRIGLLISFIMAGINLMLDLYMEWYYVYSLVITLSFISLLALSLYQTSKSQTASNLL